MAHVNRQVSVNEIGVERCCFGEFRCAECNRSWESSKAWRDYGQECKNCHGKVKPHTIQALFFYCCKECARVWKYKWIEEGAKCSSCKEIKLPRTYKQYRVYWLPLQLSHEGKGVIDRTKSHEFELCEYCLKKGSPCYLNTKQHPKKSTPVLINGRRGNTIIWSAPAPVIQLIPKNPHAPGRQPISYRDAARASVSAIPAESSNNSNNEIRIRNQSFGIGTRTWMPQEAARPDSMYNQVIQKLPSNNEMEKPNVTKNVDSLTQKSNQTTQMLFVRAGPRHAQDRPVDPLAILFILLIYGAMIVLSGFKHPTDRN